MNGTSPNDTNWQPDMEKIGIIINLIEYIQSSDNKKQKEAFEKFHELKKKEEFSAYCAAIFSRTSLSIQIRRQSGLLLKEALRHNFRKQNGLTNHSNGNDNDSERDHENKNIISDSVLSVCKKCLIQCLCEESEPSKFIRETSAIAITTIVRELHPDSNNAFNQYDSNEFDEWPKLIDTLLNLLKQHQNDKNPLVIQSILNLIHLLCHDCGRIMGECLSSHSLIEALLGFASSSNLKMREFCLKSLYYLFQWQSGSLVTHLNNNMDKYINLILLQMNGGHHDIGGVTKVIVDTVIVLMNEYWIKLSGPNTNNIGIIFEFILDATKNAKDSDISCTAAEFWALYATDTSKDNKYLTEFFPKLLPVLVSRCKYTEELLSLIDFATDDQSCADLAEDMAPLHYKDRGGADVYETKSGEHVNAYQMDEEESSWNIRKCAATQLEKLSFCGGELKSKLLSCVLPMIKHMVESRDFLDIEAGLLVLGAITQREYESIIPSLPELIPFILLQCDNKKHILVQQIASWSLARFSNWYYSSVEGDIFYEKILYQFLSGMKSSSKRVQRASCGAIATFLTSCNEKILAKKEYIEALINTFLQAFENYHLRNFPHLIDVILCCTNVIVKNTQNQQQSQNNILCDPKFQDALLPPILKRWVSLTGDTNIFPLFEAITQWTTHIGHTQHYQQNYLPDIFDTVLNICVDVKNACREYNEYVAQHEQDAAIEKPNKEFWVCGLDLLAVLVEKCNPSIRNLIWNGNHQKLLAMIYCSICETHFNVRRNGLALLGDIITLNAREMQMHICKFLKIIIANLNWDWQTVCTNASWCIGQCLMVYGDQMGDNGESIMEGYCDEILSRLVEILKYEKSPPYIVTNVAITMARLVKKFPNKIIKKWDQFAVEWIKSLSMFQEDDDKIEAFQTLMVVVMKNPIAVVQSRNGCTILFESIAEWKQPPTFLNEQFQKVLAGFKNAAPNWQNIMNRLSPNTQEILKSRYNV